MGESSGLKGLLATACGRGGPGPGGGGGGDGGVGRPVDVRQREAAFEELMRLVMIYIRAGMGRRLRDHRESADVCQSVAKSFIEDFESGKLVFESEAQLAAYLQRVVQSKLADLARRDAAAKRGGGARAAALGGSANAVADAADAAYAGAGASADLRREEAHRDVLKGLTEEEQAIVRLRQRGLSWEQIASMLGKDPAALRQQFSRAQRRVGGGGGEEKTPEG